MSQADSPLSGRATPRWSVVTELPETSVQFVAALIAALPGNRAWVAVVPGGFSASGPRLSCAGVTVVKLILLQLPSVSRFAPEAVIVP